MSSFTPIPTLDGYEVDDLTACWWTEYDDQVWWSDKQWTMTGDPEADIGRADGIAWSGYVERRRELPEGIAFLHDPQVFTGLNWALFSLERRVAMVFVG